MTDRIDSTAVLHEFWFYTFEDEDSMTDDAAQFFASYWHNKWFSCGDDNDSASYNDNNSNGEESGDDINCGDDNDFQGRVEGILIFLSIEDRVCFISSGDSISFILPWWRLERVVDSMKEDLRKRCQKTTMRKNNVSSSN